MKVLIFTIKFGSGHFRASKSLCKQIRNEFETSEVVVKDICEYLMPHNYQKIYNAYHLLVNKGSKLYNILYKYSEKTFDGTPSYPHLLLKKIDKLIASEQPDVVISTCSVSSQLFSAYKEKYKSNLPFITCITDISSHPSWITPQTNFYLVGTELVKQGLMDKGVDEKDIYISGIPVEEEFVPSSSRNERAHKNLLIMGGGLGMLPEDLSFYQEINDLSGVKTVIIAGRNQRLFDQLNGKFNNITVVGYTDKVYEYMHEADLIITKPGGMTLFESIISEVPIVVLRPELEQERKNQSFIEKTHIGYILEEEEDRYIMDIDDLIHDDMTLSKMKMNMAEVKKGFDRRKVIELLSSIEAKKGEAEASSS